MRAACEMNDRARTCDEFIELGVGRDREIAHRTDVGFRRRVRVVLPDDRAIRPSRALEMSDERAPDEAAGSGDDDDVRIAHVSRAGPPQATDLSPRGAASAASVGAVSSQVRSKEAPAM